MFVYASTGWVPAGSSVNGTSRRFRYIAAAGQTTFTGSDSNGNTMAYDAGFVDVYLNGVRLDQTDYTATSGTSIVLASAAALNDELNIVAFGTFSVASINGVDIINGTISANKLAAGAAVSNIGYTPVNKAGDTMTGELVVPKVGVGVSGSSYQIHNRVFGNAEIATQYGTGNIAVLGAYSDGAGFGIAGTIAVKADSAGRVTMPYQPAFKAQWANGSFNFGAGVTFWDQAVFNIGGHYNTANGRFTAPVTGTYHFVLQSQHYGGTTATGYHDIRLNGGDLNCRWEDANAQSNYNAGCVSVTVRMNAGDWVDCYSSGAVWWADNSFFCGYLVG